MNDTVTRYLSIPRLCDKLSRKKSWVYNRAKNDPTFPQARNFCGRRVFVESEIDQWVEQQTIGSRGGE